VEGFVGLLNHLRVTVEDMDTPHVWGSYLLDIIRSSGGIQHLSHWYWELLVEIVILDSHWLRLDWDPVQSLQIITSLNEAKEWSKLECWMGIVWMLLQWEVDVTVRGDLGHSMLLLLRQRPGAVQKLEKWMERLLQGIDEGILGLFKQTCTQAHEAAQRDVP